MDSESTSTAATETAIVSHAHQADTPELQVTVLAPGARTIPMQYDAEGNKRWELLARVGHSQDRLVQALPSDMQPQDLPSAALVPSKPEESVIEHQLQSTQDAINKILAAKGTVGQVRTAAALKDSATIVKYTPKGESSVGTRIVKVQEAPRDPFDPPKFSHKRAPKPPPSPPPPVLHSPPRKVSAEEQRAWHIPPCVSNWKNAKGYTIPLDKRLAADGRGLREIGISEGFTSLSEALYLAEKHSREEVEKRALLERKLAEKEHQDQEERLRQLAEKAREEKEALAMQMRREQEHRVGRGRSRSRSRSRSRDRSYSRERDYRGRSRGRRERHQSRSRSRSREASDAETSKFGPIRVHGADRGLTLKEREELRRQMSREHERDLRISRLSSRRGEQRDATEQAALGQKVDSAGKPTGEAALFDQRLFDQTAGLDQGFHDDEAYNIYDKPLFGSSAVHLIYRPTIAGGDAIDEDAADGVGDKGAQPEALLHRAARAFQGADRDGRAAGPVEFEEEKKAGAKELNLDDPFGLDQFLAAAKNKPPNQDHNSHRRT